MGRDSPEKDLLLKAEEDYRNPERLCGSHRLVVTMLLMLSFMLCFANQSSMGSTMICMLAVDPNPEAPSHLPNDTDTTTAAATTTTATTTTTTATTTTTTTTTTTATTTTTTPSSALPHSDVYDDVLGREGEEVGGGNSTMSSFPVATQVSTLVTRLLSSLSSSSSSSSSSLSSSSPVQPNGSLPLPSHRYDWDKTTQGWIHSSLFIGYYVVLLPSGFLATKYGGKRVIIFGLLASSVAQLLTPFAASLGVVWLCVVRALCGGASGFIYAPVFAVLANWVPNKEANLLFGLAGAGMELGNVVSFLMSALTCQLDIMGGWPLMYYAIGGVEVVTALAVHCLVSDLPSQNTWVSRRECLHIETLIGQAGGHGHKGQSDDDAPLTRTIPVWSILTSLPVWAIVVSQTGSDWLFYLTITVAPTFMKEVMHMDNMTITLLTGLPFLGIMAVIYGGGKVAETLSRRYHLSTATVRKLSDFVCKILPGALLVSLGHLGPGQEAVFIVLYTLTCLLCGFIYLSWITNPVDLSPAYTGFIASVSETGAMWVAIAVPIITENVTKDRTVEEWQWMLYITGGIQVVTFVFYCIFGSSELQPWGRPDTDCTIPPSSSTDDEEDPTTTTTTTLENGPSPNPDLDPDLDSRQRSRPQSRKVKATRYRSRSLVGQGRLYRSLSLFLSDDEESLRRGHRSPIDVVLRPAVPMPMPLPATPNSHLYSPLPRKASQTSEIEPDYITMTRVVTSEESSASEKEEEERELVGNSYESMHFGARGSVGPSDFSVYSSSSPSSSLEEEEPVYENVILGPGPPLPGSQSAVRKGCVESGSGNVSVHSPGVDKSSGGRQKQYGSTEAR